VRDLDNPDADEKVRGEAFSTLKELAENPPRSQPWLPHNR